MTNNDKLRQVISNVQLLNELANSMCDTEIYPVSFFSQAYDLIQKIQNDIHKLETDQVEMFAEQLKKHQALILSIHQQMSNFSIPAQHLFMPETKPASPERIQEPVPAQPAVSEPPPVEPTPAEKPLTEAPVIQQAKPMPPDAPPARPAPVETPVTPPARPAPVETPVTPPARPVPTETPVTRPARPVPTETPITRPARPVPTETPVARPVSAEETPTINDVIEKRKMSDLRKAFSLNDHFRYRKELFGGSEEAMNKVITILNNKKSLQESIVFLEQKLHWDLNDPTVKDFVKMLEVRFL